MSVSPRQGRWIHGIAALFWLAQIVACPFFVEPSWKLYLLEISLWANFASHVAGVSAERPTKEA